MAYLSAVNEAAAARCAADAVMYSVGGRSSAHAAGLCRIAEPVCKAMATKDLKQRPGTVKRVADACLAFVELEQAEAVLVRTLWVGVCRRL